MREVMTIDEARIHALIARSRAVSTEVIAMQANDRGSQEGGAGGYTEESYLRCANELYTISDQIELLARNGSF